jgi:predicted Fe-Mo cluster-binding NifX family protein
MKAALTVWEGRISPVFDVSREALVLTVEDGKVVARSSQSIETPTAALKLERLAALGVDTLICGAISEPLHRELDARGMRVIAFVAGEIEVVEAALLTGRLPGPSLLMPGCRRRRMRCRGGGSGGRRSRGRRPE